MKKFFSALTICSMIFFTGCGSEQHASYKSLPQNQVAKMMVENPDAILLDVRTVDEFEKKHLPKAKSVPLEEFQDGNFSSLPDKNATILIYCWTGRRAQDAAQILVDKGYKNVYELGGMVDWTGPVEGTELYKTITQEEAVEMLAADPNAKLLDCRFPKDYEARHIVGAIHFPLEAAVAENFEKIPDKDATLITYCGDGNRGRLTAKTLVEKGYKNVYTMGGIIDWKGPVEGTEVQ